MLSFTSSFELAPRARWGLQLGIFILVFASLLASFEFYWRIRGVEENYIDNLSRWSYFREDVDSLVDRHSTILVGASRIQLGWSMDTFREMMPEIPIIHLAIDGMAPWAILRDLSDNTEFSGIIVISFAAPSILPEARDSAQGYVDFYNETWGLNTKINFRLDDFLQGYLISRQPIYGIRQTIIRIGLGYDLRSSTYLQTTWERERNADYQRVNIQRHKGRRIQQVKDLARKFQPPTTAVWDESLEELDHVVRPMVQRGARVVFIRFPSSEEHWNLDQKMFPRERYWDDMAMRVSGDWVHFKDVEGIDHFILPDTSHLDKRDKEKFTQLLIVKLQELGIY